MFARNYKRDGLYVRVATDIWLTLDRGRIEMQLKRKLTMSEIKRRLKTAYDAVCTGKPLWLINEYEIDREKQIITVGREYLLATSRQKIESVTKQNGIF